MKQINNLYLIINILVSLENLLFCVLAMIVLLYYVRRWYSLNVEMKTITPEQLWSDSYKNHLKNLKIKAMISKFVVIILTVEILKNFLSLMIYLLYWIFHIITFEIHWLLLNIESIFVFSYFPLLCLLLKVLWLAYVHFPYKYTIMRWTAYIVLRIVAIYFIDKSQFIYDNNSTEQSIWSILYPSIQTVIQVFDLVIYFKYSRRFYRHLKARELEARLFYDKDNYIENRYIRFHFLIASIIVGIAFFFYIIKIVTFEFHRIVEVVYHILLDHSIKTFELKYISNAFLIIEFFFLVLYKSLQNLNYLYVFAVIVYKYCRQKRKLTNVNNKIHSLVLEVQGEYYSLHDN